MAVTMEKQSKVSVEKRITDLSKSDPSLAEIASLSLEKFGDNIPKMDVIVLLDASGSMSGYYSNGTVNAIVKGAIANAMILDQDGTIQVYPYDGKLRAGIDVTLQNYQTIVDQKIGNLGGATAMGDVMNAAIHLCYNGGNAKPLYVIHVTDGYPSDPAAARTAYVQSASYPMHIVNLAVDPGGWPFLEELDDMPSGGPGERIMDNCDSVRLFHDPSAAAAGEFAKPVSQCTPADWAGPILNGEFQSCIAEWAQRGIAA